MWRGFAGEGGGVEERDAGGAAVTATLSGECNVAVPKNRRKFCLFIIIVIIIGRNIDIDID